MLFRVLQKKQEFDNLKEKGAKVKPTDIPKFIIQNCKFVLLQNETYLQKELEKAKNPEEEKYYAEGDYQHACNIREIRLRIVQKAILDVESKKCPYIEDLALLVLTCLQKLYLTNSIQTQKYLLHNKVNFQMGLGRLSTDLHFYITELARLGGFSLIEDQQKAYNSKHDPEAQQSLRKKV